METEVIQQLQRDIGKAFGAVSTLEGTVKEIQVGLLGLNGNGGLIGDFSEFTASFAKRLDKQDQELDARKEWEVLLETRLQLYLNKSRAETCLGLPALDSYVASVKEKNESRNATIVALEKARIAMEASNRKSRNTLLAMLMVALISSSATVAVAIINKPTPIGVTK